VSSMSHFGMS